MTVLAQADKGTNKDVRGETQQIPGTKEGALALERGNSSPGGGASKNRGGNGNGGNNNGNNGNNGNGTKRKTKVQTPLELTLKNAFASSSSFPLIAKRLGVYCPENDPNIKNQIKVSLSLSQTLLYLYLYLYLYTVCILFHVEWCMRQLWCSSIIVYTITSIAYNQSPY